MPNWEPPTPSQPQKNSKKSSQEGVGNLGDTIQNFRDFYRSIQIQEGDQKLRKTFSQERELSKQIPDPQERGVFLHLIRQLELELLPEQQ
jgi:hypothetical protein